MSSRPFEARCGGRCAECSERIEPGDDVRWNDSDEIVGEDCCGYQYADDDEVDEW